MVFGGVEQAIFGIFGGFGDWEVEVAGDGDGNFVFGETFFVELAFDDFAVAIGDIGRNRGAGGNADAGLSADAAHADWLSGDGIGVGAGFIADARGFGDIRAATGGFSFFEFGGDYGGALGAVGRIGFDLD